MINFIFLFFTLFAVDEYFSCLVQPNLTLLPIEEAVDVRLAQADEGQEDKNMEGVHPLTLEFSLCRLAECTMYVFISGLTNM